MRTKTKNKLIPITCLVVGAGILMSAFIPQTKANVAEVEPTRHRLDIEWVCEDGYTSIWDYTIISTKDDETIKEMLILSQKINEFTSPWELVDHVCETNADMDYEAPDRDIVILADEW